jgi:predicted DNA binding CopG/RHH family protein
MKKEYELSKLKKRPGKVKVDPGAAKIPISLRLDAQVLLGLRAEAERLGLPYQTLMSSVLHRYVNGDLVDLKSVDLKELMERAS